MCIRGGMRVYIDFFNYQWLTGADDGAPRPRGGQRRPPGPLPGPGLRADLYHHPQPRLQVYPLGLWVAPKSILCISYTKQSSTKDGADLYIIGMANHNRNSTSRSNPTYFLSSQVCQARTSGFTSRHLIFSIVSVLPNSRLCHRFSGTTTIILRPIYYLLVTALPQVLCLLRRGSRPPAPEHRRPPDPTLDPMCCFIDTQRLQMLDSLFYCTFSQNRLEVAQQFDLTRPTHPGFKNSRRGPQLTHPHFSIW